MAWIPRHKQALLESWLAEPGEHHDVILVEGARQVGKTSLVRRVLDGHEKPVHMLDLERDALLRSRIDGTDEFSQFEELLRDELRLDPEANEILFIDEAQESRRLGHYVRYMKEIWPGTRVVLTGSTLRRLFADDVRYPVGRVQRLRLRPLTFSEFLDARGGTELSKALITGPLPVSTGRHERLLDEYDHYLQVGGMPAIVSAQVAGDDWRRQRAALIADLEQDFLRLFGPERFAVVQGCFRSVANYVGSPSKLASVIPSPTAVELRSIKEIFARLELWNLVLRSDQRGPSPEASQRFHPKRYLFDTGCLREQRETSVPSLSLAGSGDPSLRRILGGILENQTAIEIHDHWGELSGWKRSSQGLEVDFVIRDAGGTWPLECKAVAVVKGTHLKGMLSYLDEFDLPLGVVVSLAPQELIDRGGRRVLNVPAYLLERLPDLLGA